MTPIAPPGAEITSASREEYPKVVIKMLEKVEIPPFDIELRSVKCRQALHEGL